MSDLEVGSSIKLNLNGTPWDWLVVHQGLPSDMYDESCNGTWLLLKDIYETRAWNSTKSNILESSTIHSYLNGDFQNLFDSNIKGTIQQVKIPYRKNGGSGGTDQSGANGLSTKVFLLSGYEVGWVTGDPKEMWEDGAKLSYFESGTGTSASNKRIAYKNGSTYPWWCRSPRVSGSYVTTVGVEGEQRGTLATAAKGVRPAIILDPDFIVTDAMLA